MYGVGKIRRDSSRYRGAGAGKCSRVERDERRPAGGRGEARGRVERGAQVALRGGADDECARVDRPRERVGTGIGQRVNEVRGRK